MTAPEEGPPDAAMWAIENGHEGTIEYLEGVRSGVIPSPKVGDVLTQPHLVDPITKLPCPVRVSRLFHAHWGTFLVVLIVVVRALSD